MYDFVFLKIEKNYFKLKFSEILYFHSEKKYVKIVTFSGSHLVVTPMSMIEKLLPRDQFCRIHRSYIISLQHTKKFNCEFVYIGNQKIPVSENYRNVLKNSVTVLTGETKPFNLDNGDVDKLLKDIDP